MVIPHTINDVLMARIDRLEEETRNLVKIASVIGRNFFHRILAEVARTVEDIDDRLSYLKEIQLIRERRRMEEVEYLFKHALAQEAAYESILVQKRKELHLKTADSIEKIFNERLHEFYGMLALHYSRGENIDKSEEYMIKAGDVAICVWARSKNFVGPISTVIK
jgi:predicted ATPase